MSFIKRFGALTLGVFLLAGTACSGSGPTGNQDASAREITLNFPTAPPQVDMPHLICLDDAVVASIIGQPVTDKKTSEDDSGLSECYYEFGSEKLLFMAFRRNVQRTGHPGRGMPANDLGPDFIRFRNQEQHGAICEVFEPTLFDVVIYDFRTSHDSGMLCGWANQLIKLPFHEPVPAELAIPAEGRPGACNWLGDADLPVPVGPETTFSRYAQQTTMFGRPFVPAQGCQVTAGDVHVWWWVSESLPADDIAQAVKDYDSGGGRRADVGDAGFKTFPLGIACVKGDRLIEVAIQTPETAGREEAELRLAQAVVAAIS
ncbi:hypothetical protein [Micromonospora sp. DT229]|uniref:hypothetical protein n=1 Tax=Micromonospora sp. DT229 TaxID=3393430 RepID=UPI003CF4500E